jgi:hypothetical protein
LQIVNGRNLADNDVIGWLLAKDILDDALDIVSDRNINLEILQMDLELVSSEGCKDITDADEERVYRGLVEGSIRGKTRAFLQGFELHERMKSLRSSKTARRNANIRESDRHSESMALRPRKAADDIINGEFTEHHPDSGQAGKNLGKPANDDPVKPASEPSGQVARGSSTPAQATKVTTPGSSHSGSVKKRIVIAASPGPKDGAATASSIPAQATKNTIPSSSYTGPVKKGIVIPARQVANDVGISANDGPGKPASPASGQVAKADVTPASPSPWKPALRFRTGDTE